jgi:ArsR family transcriptional regulator, arsenate/arsenite/antimonite-responsive transcriptional repressor
VPTSWPSFLKRHLHYDFYFDIIGNMETKEIVQALGALAQESRLAIFRLLVQAGAEGLAVGAIAQALGLANATLSFHLKELTSADLLIATPNGRSIIYAANFATVSQVLMYLTENCCQGAPCTPTEATGAVCMPKQPKQLKATS